MVNEEILGGIKNAMERGHTFEKAIQSFINAGYNPQEVQETAAYFSRGAMTAVHPESAVSQPFLAPPQSTSPTRSSKDLFNSFFSLFFAPENRIYTIIGIAILLLIILGAIIYLFV